MKPQIGIGTAQWGMPYGIRNSQGQTSQDQIKKIIESAKKESISLIDTAPSYGNAETSVGDTIDTSFKIVTKLSQIEQIDLVDSNSLRTAFSQSLKRLKRDSVYGILVHKVEDLFTQKQKIITRHLLSLKQERLALKVGVSIYTQDQIDRVLEIFEPDIIQLPVNVFDQRLVDSGAINHLHKQGIEVHVRSIFLQGLLLFDEKNIPSKFQAIAPSIKRWNRAAKDQGLTLVEACLLHARQITGVHSIILGVDSIEHFNECVNIYKSNLSFDSSGLNLSDETFLNPSLWRNL